MREHARIRALAGIDYSVWRDAAAREPDGALLVGEPVLRCPLASQPLGSAPAGRRAVLAAAHHQRELRQRQGVLLADDAQQLDVS